LTRRTRTQRASAKTDDAALLLWQAAALIRAEKSPPRATFGKNLLTNKFLRKFAMLSVLPDGPERAKELLADHGIIFLINPTLPGTFLDGAVMLLHGKTPVIALNKHAPLQDRCLLFHARVRMHHFRVDLRRGGVDRGLPGARAALELESS